MANNTFVTISTIAANISTTSDTDYVFVITQDHIAQSSNPALFWSNVKSDGGDLRLYGAAAQGDQLPIEVVHIDTALEELVLWVRRPTVAPSTATDMYLECGDATLTQPAVAAAFGRNAVWADYWIYTHDLVTDSTGRFSGAFTVSGNPVQIDGPHGNPNGGYDFDGTGDWIDVPLGGNEPLGALGFEDPVSVDAWLGPDTTETNTRAVFFHGSSVYLNISVQIISNPDTGERYGLVAASGGAGAPTRHGTVGSAGVYEKVWGIDPTIGGQSGVDASVGYNSTSTTAAGGGTTFGGGSNADSIRFGARQDDFEPFFGKVAEVGLSFAAPAVTKKSTEYLNQSSSTFFTVGTVTGGGAGGLTSSGTLIAQSSVTTGTATKVEAPRTSSGTLVAQSSVTTGTATNVLAGLVSSGVLVAQSSVTTGTATKVEAPRTSTGTLVAQSSVTTGTSTNVPLGVIASGTLAAQSSVTTGTATKVEAPRTSSGTLVAQSSVTAGTAFGSSAGLPPSDIIPSVQLDDPGSALIDLFEIVMSSTETIYLYPGLDGGADPIWFPNRVGDEINKYLAVPIEISGIEYGSEGAQARPTLNVANILNGASAGGDDTTLFSELASFNSLTNQTFIGKKLIRRRTLGAHLVEEFDTPAIPEEFPIASYIIDRVSSENNIAVSFELASPLDVEGVKVPNRVIVGKYCSWQYQGYFSNPSKGGCPWKTDSRYRVSDDTVGGTNSHYVYFDEFDNPCVDSTTPSSVWAGGPVSKNVVVTDGGERWRSNVDANTTTPSITSSDWQLLVVYSTWSAGVDYVYIPPVPTTVIWYNNRIWTPKKFAPAGSIPSKTSAFWKRVDICGKTINSCKVRFQYIPTDLAAQNKEGVPSVETNTEKPLPFGGYPGTAKFR
jgi:lambda family phage minor tail protein L